MLRTRDVNQNELTAFAAVLPVLSNENCKLVTVTEEKKIAIVDKLTRLLCCCATIAGTPGTQ